MWNFFSLFARKPPVCRPRTCRILPRVEALEGRCCPSGGSMEWSDPVPGFVGPGNAAANFALSQPDGKIIASGIGHSTTGNTVVALARYGSAGGLDTSFGTGGVAQASYGPSPSYSDWAALYPNSGTANDGKIVLDGWYTPPAQPAKKHQPPPPPPQTEIALARFNTNGTLDTTFGTGGEVLTSLAAGSVAPNSGGVAVTSAGQVVVAAATPTAIVLVRYNANGSLDSTFGQGGEVVTPFSSAPSFGNMIQQADGKLIVTGGVSGKGPLIRYNANGTIDTSFGTGGFANGPFAVGTSAAIYPSAGTANDGKIVVTQYNNAGPSLIARFNTNGTLDTTFGTNGEISAAYPLWDVRVAADGKVVAVGGSFTVVRYNADGSPDSSFGVNGIVTNNIPGAGTAYAMTIQPSGDIVAVGTTANVPRTFLVACYLPSEPEIGSFTANPNPVTAGSNVTLTASNITDANPNSTITQVTFYYFDSGGNKVTLGTGTQTSPGVWTLNYTVNLASGRYTIYAQAEDSYGVFGDPFAVSLTVQ